MIKLIIFDLDGVLVDAKQIHYDTLNQAICEVDTNYVITPSEHLTTYDGLKTTQKLKILTQNKGLPSTLHDQIWRRKQELTLQSIGNLRTDQHLIDIFKELKDYKIACCSNSIRKSVFVMLNQLGLIGYMDLILSNEDVQHSKPHPEMYWKAMSMTGCLPEETLIVEDSPTGLLAANRSGAKILRVNSPTDLNMSKIFTTLDNFNTNNMNIPKWQGGRLNVLIPMAGAGSRFASANYTFPKPIIDVMGKPMIQVVVENLNIDANYIFIVRKEHREKYNLDIMLNLIAPGCKVVEVDHLTDGAACTTLLAREYIDTDLPLLIANADQYIEWNSNEFMYKMNESGVDGGILTFTTTHPKWSFVKLDENGYVVEVAEKKPISDIATVGIYYWARGSDYVRYTNQMIDKDIRVNNEFYVAPVYNEAVADKLKITTFAVDKMLGIGTPEDLYYFTETYRK